MTALPQRFLAGLLIALALLLPGAIAAQTFPPLTGQVVDAANIIPLEMEAGLTAKLARLEQQSQRQLVVVTLPDLQGYDIADYGYQLGRHWGIGDKERNDGALLIVAPNERKVRIEVGYGLEPVLTDGMSSLIINQAIIAHFKQGDMPAGIEAGAGPPFPPPPPPPPGGPPPNSPCPPRRLNASPSRRTPSLNHQASIRA